MIADILIAFVIALILEMLSLTKKIFEQITVIACCTCLIVTYFLLGCQIDFIGEIDLEIWLSFVVMFYKVFELLENGIKRYI